MPRLDVRCKVDLPVSVIIDAGSNGNVIESKSKFSSLSLGGGFIEFVPPPQRK